MKSGNHHRYRLSQIPLHQGRGDPEQAIPSAAELGIPARILDAPRSMQGIPTHLHDERSLASEKVHYEVTDDRLAHEAHPEL